MERDEAVKLAVEIVSAMVAGRQLALSTDKDLAEYDSINLKRLLRAFTADVLDVANKSEP